VYLCINIENTGIMGNDILEFVAPVEDKMQGIIKVVGVGGGGCNAVRNMYLDKACGAAMWTKNLVG
jgi:cell division protein FtsZ